MPLVASVVTGVAHLAVGYLYLISGLVAPVWALITLWVWWVALSYVGLRLARKKSYLVLLVPVVGIVSWVALMAVGGRFLGWSA